MKQSRVIPTLIALGVPLAGCTADWYERDADREITRILEQRKDETLKYKPQTVAPVPKNTTPTTQAYSKIPMTEMPTSSANTSPLERRVVDWTPEPLGPALPPPRDNNRDDYDYVPASYADYGISMEPQGPPTPGDVAVALDLLGSVQYAVTHARDYQDRMEDLFLVTLDVTLQRHLFEPLPFAQTETNFTGNQSGPSAHFGTPYNQALNVVNRVGVKQQLPYGGEIVAQQIVSVTDGLNKYTQDGQDATTALTASIPLLKGAGLVNLEPLIASERQLVYAVRSFETYRRRFAVNVATQFFSLVSQQQGIANRRKNYEDLKELSTRALTLFDAGRMQFLDVQRALQNQLTAESNLIDAINSYQASLDSFKVSLGMSVRADLEIVPIALNVNVPDIESGDATAVATLYRLELQTARDQIEDARRGVSNAKNGLLPDLKVFGAATAGNLPGKNWNRYNDDSGFYSAGAVIDWPIDELAERNTYRASLITLARAQRAYITAREQVISDVRQSTRAIRVAQVNLAIQMRGVELNQKRLDLANERLIQGKAQMLDVTDAQAALLNSQDALDRARANLQSQVLNYLRDTGTLRLDPNGGAIARAMDRAAVEMMESHKFDEIDRTIQTMEKQ